MEAGAIDQTRDHLVNVVLGPDVRRHDRVEVLGIVRGWEWVLTVVAPERRTLAEMRDHLARDREGVRIVEREVVRDAGDAGVQVGAAQLLGAHVDPGGSFHQRRAADEDRALSLHDDGLVAHGRNVRAPSGGRAHDDRELRDRERRKAGLVVEDPAEVLAVRKDLILARQERAA